MKKKILGCILTAAMAVALTPLTASAVSGDAGAEVWDGSVDISWFTEQPWGTDEEPADYYIETPAQLAGLAYIVNGRLDTDQFPIRYKEGTTETTDADIDVPATVDAVIDGAEDDGATASGLKAEDLWTETFTHIDTEGGGSGVTEYDLYVGNQTYDFAGKTIHIMNDLDLGGYSENGTAKGPNWMPIGGRFPADIGTRNIVIDSSFNGAIEGGFHTISNLFCDRQSKGDFMLSQGVGLIGCLGSLYDDPLYGYGHSAQKESVVKEALLDGWTSSVRNLCIGDSSDDADYRGYVYANRMVGALIGRAGEAIIENCASYSTVKSTDHKGIAGIVGATSGSGVIRNCYNAGYIWTTSDGCPAGGISGSNTFSIYNCYNVGRIYAPNATTLSEGIGSHYGESYVVDNCYSLSGSFSDTREDKSKNGYYIGEATDLVVNTYVRQAATNPDSEEYGLKDPAFLNEINGNAGNIFVSADAGVNNGYPVLFWQKRGFDPDASADISIGNGSSKGTITANVASGGYQEHTVLEAGEGAAIPAGTSLILRSDAEPPNVLDYCTADGDRIRPDYYTVTGSGSVTLDGVFLTLTSGTIHIPDSSIYDTGVSKTGIVLDKNGKAWDVKDYIVSDGDILFQNDTLSTKSVLKKGVVCKDHDKEYTGKFDYYFVYGNKEPTDKDKNTTGLHSVTKEIGTEEEPDILTVTAAAKTQDKVWGTYADTEWVEDIDDIRGTYTISTPQQLAGLAKLVNSGENFEKATIKLENDLSLKNPDGDGSARLWEIIGKSSGTAFQGTFDGQGHTISAMTVRSSASAGGLFGYTTGADIHDLTVSGKVSSKGNAGGIVSIMNGGSITNCMSKVAVTSSGSRAGGIAAQMSNGASLEKCRNRGSVEGTVNVGGIAGEVLDSADKVMQCANYGTVSASGSGSLANGTGGVTGYLGSMVDECANFGPVTSGNSCVGGIAGFTYANTKATEQSYKNSSAIYDSVNRGDVEGTAAKTNTFVGGLVGRSDYLLMNNCYTTGAVSTGDAAGTYLGTVVGGFYQSIYSDVSAIYYSEEGSPATSYTKSGATIRKGTTDPKLSYFKTEKMSAAQMQADVFALLLNSNSPGTFAAVPSDAPQLTWIMSDREFKVTYTGEYTGTDHTYYEGIVDLPECDEEGYKYTFSLNGSEWDGTGVTSDLTITVGKDKIRKSSVVFMADQKKVGTMYYWTEDGSGTPYTYLSEDSIVRDGSGITEIPDAAAFAAKEGYDPAWDLSDSEGISYWDAGRTAPLGTGTITVRAMYQQRTLPFEKNDNGEGSIRFVAEISGSNDGYYFLAPQSKGTIVVKNGAETTLDGSNGPFTNIRLIVEEGAKLTLKDLILSTDPARVAGVEENHAVLEIEGGSTEDDATVLRYSGYNSITGTNDGSNGKDNENIFPAVNIDGYVRFDRSGADGDTLHIVCGKDSPDINIENGAAMEVAGGIVEVYRKERLGRNGGMIYGSSFDYTTQTVKGDQKGDLIVSGGSLIAVSDSNKVFAACVNKYTQTGGQAIFYAPQASLARAGDEKYTGTDVALYADQTDVTGGSLSMKVKTYKDTLTDPVNYYSNADAVQSGDRFNEKYFLCAIDTSGWDQSRHTVMVDDVPYYEGKGNNVSHPINTSDKVRDQFSSKRSKADPLIYLWLSRGSRHKVEVDGTVLGESVSETDAEHVKYLPSIKDDTVTLHFLDQTLAAADTGKTKDGEAVKEGTVVALACYDDSDECLGLVSDHSFLLTDEEQAVSVKSELIKKADHMKLFIYDGEKTLRPLVPDCIVEHN